MTGGLCRRSNRRSEENGRGGGLFEVGATVGMMGCWIRVHDTDLDFFLGK
jgi:hypothetical protein